MEPPPANNAELVRAALAGDEQSFERFVVGNRGAVRAVARLQLRSDADIDDVVQDTFIRAYQRLDSLQDPDRARPWLLAIARNVAIDRRRANQRRQTVPADEVEVDLADDAAGPDIVSELRELVQFTETTVGHLSHRDAVVLDMVARLGFSPTDIGQALDLTPGAAKVALHRARQRLRDALLAEALLERGEGSCPQFHDLYEQDGLDAAVTHGRGCAACIDRGRSALLGMSATRDA